MVLCRCPSEAEVKSANNNGPADEGSGASDRRLFDFLHLFCRGRHVDGVVWSYVED